MQSHLLFSEICHCAQRALAKRECLAPHVFYKVFYYRLFRETLDLLSRSLQVASVKMDSGTNPSGPVTLKHSSAVLCSHMS